jgi:hypothetical protein
MDAQDRHVDTEAGPLTVRDVARVTLEKLATLFPKVGWIDHEGRRLLALLPIEGSRVLRGFRTGYGWYPPEKREWVETMLGVERLRIVQATAAYRSRGFQGVLMPAACLTGGPGEPSQLGELLFMRSRGSIARGLGNTSPIAGYEEAFGEGATDALLSFVAEILTAWKREGASVTVTDLEPCPADWKGAQWRADLVITDDRIVVIRPELVPEDPLLRALVEVGITEVEHTSSVILVQPAEA